MLPLEELMAKRAGSVDPSKFPDEQFDLYSIPAFDKGCHEVVAGSEIGSTKQVVEPNDVLLSKIVPHIRRSWVVGQSNGRRMIASGEWIVFRSDKADPAYLRHVLVGDPFHAQFMQTVSGVGGSLLRARPAQVAKIKIPLPPIPEQRRIATILDQADALRSKRREALAQLDSLTQSIFIEMFGDPATNPKGWTKLSLESVASKVTDGEHQTPRRTETGIKLLSARNVRDGYLDFDDVDYIDEEEYSRISRRCNPERGDILISCSGSIGRVAAIDTDEPLGMVRSAALVKPDFAKIRSKYLEAYLRTPFLNRLMVKRAHSSSQANLFQGPIRALPVLIPSLKIQDEFVARIDSVNHIRKVHVLATDNLSALFHSLQHRAFQGEL